MKARIKKGIRNGQRRHTLLSMNSNFSKLAFYERHLDMNEVPREVYIKACERKEENKVLNTVTIITKKSKNLFKFTQKSLVLLLTFVTTICGIFSYSLEAFAAVDNWAIRQE